MQIISKVVQEIGVQDKLIRRPLEFFRQRRKNRGDSLSGCATQCQSGRSMIEMLGVLAIIGVLSVGGIMGYSKAMMRYKINKTIEQITYIAGNVRTTFANQGNYVGAWDPNIQKKAHIFPDDMCTTDLQYTDFACFTEFDRENTVDISTHYYDKSFSIKLPNLPTEACIEIVSHDWQQLNAKIIYVDEGFGPYLNIPVSIDNAIKSCSDEDDENSIEIIFDNIGDEFESNIADTQSWLNRN